MVTHLSNTMFGDSLTSFHAISPLPNSFEPPKPLLPRIGTLFLHLSSKTNFSCFINLVMSTLLSSIPEHSKEKVPRRVQTHN
ncbi:hypothetical protein G4B88_023270 [Cannabis sativa]|uniref:Uncharacterized protein n=1 Tax=Cannabis sativa TaxID=3483 RepID=A0A7J6HYU7_CANSA|nr:hypothetical protein G4B88_023270 [Cannabis sativa]